MSTIRLASIVWALLLVRAAVAASNPPKRQGDCLDTTTAAEINRLFRVGGAHKQIALCPLALVIVSCRPACGRALAVADNAIESRSTRTRSPSSSRRLIRACIHSPTPKTTSERPS